MLKKILYDKLYILSFLFNKLKDIFKSDIIFDVKLVDKSLFLTTSRFLLPQKDNFNFTKHWIKQTKH